jgi:hypothetical protein
MPEKKRHEQKDKTMSRSIFDGIQKTELSSRMPFFAPGKYRVKILGVHLRPRRADGVNMFIVETEILESNNEELPEGSNAAQLIKCAGDMWLGNVKRFAMAAAGIAANDMKRAEEEVTPETIEMIVSEEQPLVGLELDLKCSVIKTKKGDDFTVHEWAAIPA